MGLTDRSFPKEYLRTELSSGNAMIAVLPLISPSVDIPRPIQPMLSDDNLPQKIPLFDSGGLDGTIA